MHKRICFLYTETTGLHQSNYPVSKKKLYTFARMVSINYIIGYLKDNNVRIWDPKVFFKYYTNDLL